MVFILVRVVGLEPTRLTAEEPKGDVTLVKGFVIRYNSLIKQSFCQPEPHLAIWKAAVWLSFSL